MNKIILPQAQTGDSKSITTVTGRAVQVQFAAVELSSLITSNHLNGAVNEFYPQELQPRNRTSLASIQKVSASSRVVSLGWLSTSDTSVSGAPIIGEDMIVESGNGRVMAVRKAYAEGGCDNYRERLALAAEQFGLAEATIRSMRAPVLVRIRLTEMDRAVFAQESNHDDEATRQSSHPDIINMFESIGSDIDRTRDAGKIKAMLYHSYLQSRRTTKEQVEDAIATVLERSIKNRDGKAFSYDYTLLEKLVDRGQLAGLNLHSEISRFWHRIAEKILPDEMGSNIWLSVMARISGILNIAEMLAAIESKDFDRIKPVYEWITKNKEQLKNGSFGYEMANAFADRPLSQQEYDDFLETTIDTALYIDAPINALVDDQRALIEYITNGYGELPVSKEELLREFKAALVRKDLLPKDNTLEGDELIKALTSGLPKSSTIAKEASLQAMKDRNKKDPTDVSDWKLHSFERDLERGAKFFKAHNLSKSVMNTTEAALTEYLDGGPIPLFGLVGLEIGNAMIAADKKTKRHSEVADKVSEYVSGLIDGYEHTDSKIGSLTTKAVKSLKAENKTPQDLQGYVDSFSALVGGNITKIAFENGESVKGSGGRAYALFNRPTISIGKEPCKATIWHEMGHVIENTNPIIHNAALALIRRRHLQAIKTPKVTKLKTYTELATNKEYIVNNFIEEPYCSKFYTPSTEADSDFAHAMGTELISMGFEWLSEKALMPKLVMDKELLSIILAAVGTLNESGAS
jgi:hypothetical protein